MALFGRDEKDPKQDRPKEAESSVSSKPAAPAPSTTVSPPAPAPTRTGQVIDGVEVNAYLGKGSRLGGKLHFEGTVRVDGQVEGEISAQDALIIGESAVVTAQISGSTIVIRGKVTGDIRARKRVEIRAPGKLYGNITTPSLVIHDGVMFEGHCSMGSDPSKSDRKVTPFPKEEKKEEKGGDGTLAKVPNEAGK